VGLTRLLLALSVVVGHAGGLVGLEYAPHRPVILVEGRVAVQSFYLISGFYMALILDRVYSGPRSTLTFWVSRYMRLAPLYLLISVLTLVLATGDKFDDYSVWVLAVAGFSNIALIGQDVFMFFGYNPTTDNLKFMPDILQGGLEANPGYNPGWSMLLIAPGWSIGVEVWFYLLAPFLLRLSTRTIVIVGILSLALRVFLAEVVGWKGEPWGYRFFPNELIIFLLGSLSYRLYASNKFILSNVRQNTILLLSLYVILIFFYFLPGGEKEKRWGLFVILFFSLPSLFHFTKDWRIDRWIGELSYPTYIGHMLVIALLPELGAAKGYAVVGATLVLSAMLVILIESPMDRFRHHFANRLMSKS
jgi:peptidoglycan/LPS O-acetylase OafA/YrhL